MTKRLQELPTVTELRPETHLHVKDSRNGNPEDFQMSTDNFLKGKLNTSEVANIGTPPVIDQVPRMVDDGSGGVALPVSSGKLLTDLAEGVGDGSGTSKGVVQLSDSLTTVSGVNEGVAATPTAIKTLNDNKLENSGTKTVVGTTNFTSLANFLNNVEITDSTGTEGLRVNADSNSTTAYPSKIRNASQSLVTGFGAYGISNKEGTNTTANFNMDIGASLNANVRDFLHVSASSGSEVIRLSDTGATTVQDCTAYLSFYSVSNRAGYIGMASTGNSDLFVHSQDGGVRFYASNILKFYITPEGRSYLYGDDAIASKLTLGSTTQAGDTMIEFRDSNSASYRGFGWDNSSNQWVAEDDSSVFRQLLHSGNINAKLVDDSIPKISLSSLSGGEMLELTDSGATGASASNPFISFKDTTGDRLGYIGYGSTSNEDYYHLNEYGGHRFYSSNILKMYLADDGELSVYGSDANQYKINIGSTTQSGSTNVNFRDSTNNTWRTFGWYNTDGGYWGVEDNSGVIRELADEGNFANFFSTINESLVLENAINAKILLKDTRIGTATTSYILWHDNNDDRQAFIGLASGSNGDFDIASDLGDVHLSTTLANNNVAFYTGGMRRGYIDSSGLNLEATGSGTQLTLRDTDSSGTAATPHMYFRDSTGAALVRVGVYSSGSNHHYVDNQTSNGGCGWRTNGITRLLADSFGYVRAYGNLTANTKMYIGAGGQTSANTYIAFRDMNSNTDRDFGWSDTDNAFIAEDDSGSRLPILTTGNIQQTLAAQGINTIGSYAFLRLEGTGSITAGAVIAGSSLRFAGLRLHTSAGSTPISTNVSSGVSGSWRAMGASSANTATHYGATLFKRIS